MPPLVYSQFTQQFLRQLQMFRNENFLCDCRLVVAVGGSGKSEVRDEQSVSATDTQNGEAATLEFPAHRLVLAASSPFFRSMFNLKQKETITTVNLNNCSPECLEVILQFLYSGELHLKDCDPQQVLGVARVCQIKSLEQMLSPFTKMANGSLSPPIKTEAKVEERKRESTSESPKRQVGVCDNPLKKQNAKHLADDSSPYEPPLKQIKRSPSSPESPTSTPTRNGPSQQQQQKAHLLQDGVANAVQQEMMQNFMNQLAASGLPLLSQGAAAGRLPYGPLLSMESPNARPGYYGPLLPTRPQPASSGPQSAASIFPRALPPILIPNGLPPGIFPMGAGGLPGHLTSPPRKHEEKTGGNRMQGMNGVNGEHGSEGQEEPLSPTDAANGMMVPSTEKEGWCRNKKYIQKVPNGFMCTVCKKVYGRYNSVSYHVTIYHRNPPIRCDEPGCQFTTREARYIHFHKYYRHEIPLPKSIDLGSRSCPFCRHVAKSPAMLEKHVNRHMPDCIRVGKSYCCQQCNKELPSQKAMVEHMLSHGEEKVHQCDECSYRGRTASNLRQHKLFKHSSEMFKKKFQCDQCGYCCPTEGNLDAHKRRVHKMDIPFKKDKMDDLFVGGEDDMEEDFDPLDSVESQGNLHISMDDEPLDVAELDQVENDEEPEAEEEQESEMGTAHFPLTPPPSCASSREAKKQLEDTVVNASPNDSPSTDSAHEKDATTTDLNNGHSDLLSVNTGYHSVTNELRDPIS